MMTSLTAASAWTLSGHQAQLTLAQGSCSVDLLAPSQGLTVQMHEDIGPLDNVLGIDWSLDADEQWLDCYPRGNDLIAVYAPTQRHPVRMQALWRRVDHPLYSIIDLHVSAQTELLDANPELQTRSSIAASEILWLTSLDPVRANQVPLAAMNFFELPAEVLPHVMLCRYRERPTTYVEIVHPMDVGGDRMTYSIAELRGTLSHRLFVGTLEKGVILRSRIRGAWVPRSGDIEHAARLYAAFVQSELPLTT